MAQMMSRVKSELSALLGPTNNVFSSAQKPENQNQRHWNPTPHAHTHTSRIHQSIIINSPSTYGSCVYLVCFWHFLVNSQHALASTALPNRNWLTWSLVIYIVSVCDRCAYETERQAVLLRNFDGQPFHFLLFFLRREERAETPMPCGGSPPTPFTCTWIFALPHNVFVRAHKFARSCVQFHYFNLIAKLSVGSIKKQLLGHANHAILFVSNAIPLSSW